MLRKLPIVAVFGQGTALTAERARLARAVGAMVARLGAHLLTGGGYGVMAAAAEGFVTTLPRTGLSIGIVPREPDGPLDEPNHDLDGKTYPNPFVEIAIMTPLPPRVDGWTRVPARNHVNVFTAHGIVALPGGPGTGNELEMAVFYRGESQRPREQRRTILIGPVEEFTPAQRDQFVHAATLEVAGHHLRAIMARHGFALTPEMVS